MHFRNLLHFFVGMRRTRRIFEAQLLLKVKWKGAAEPVVSRLTPQKSPLSLMDVALADKEQHDRGNTSSARSSAALRCNGEGWCTTCLCTCSDPSLLDSLSPQQRADLSLLPARAIPLCQLRCSTVIPKLEKQHSDMSPASLSVTLLNFDSPTPFMVATAKKLRKVLVDQTMESKALGDLCNDIAALPCEDVVRLLWDKEVRLRGRLTDNALGCVHQHFCQEASKGAMTNSTLLAIQWLYEEQRDVPWFLAVATHHIRFLRSYAEGTLAKWLSTTKEAEAKSAALVVSTVGQWVTALARRCFGEKKQ